MAEPSDNDTLRGGGRIWQWMKRRLKVLVIEVGLVALVLVFLVLIGGIVIHPDPFRPSPGERVRGNEGGARQDSERRFGFPQSGGALHKV